MSRKTALIILLCITVLCAGGFLGNYLLSRSNTSTFTVSAQKNIQSDDKAPQNSNEENLENAPVNINTASVDELKNIEGLSQKNAEAIFNFRCTYGQFSNIEEIIFVPGISRDIFLAIESQIYVN